MRNVVDTSGAAPPSNTSNIYPVPNATTPYWRTELHANDEYRSTEDLPSECDVAIIGGGMSGVTTAYHILNACKHKTAPSIVLLEARQVCSGATGRNGGHSKIQAKSVHNAIEQYGFETAMEIVEHSRNIIYALKNIVESEGLDCEFEMRRSFDVSLDEGDAQQARARFRHALKDDQEWTKDVDLAQNRYVEQVTSMKDAKAALSVPACSLWPYKFVSQLLQRLIDRDAINVQTNTPVSRVVRHKALGFSSLFTERGTLRARNVIFATNGYTSGVSPEYLHKIVPYRGAASHISPASPVSPHLSNTYNITFQPGRVDYLNPRPDGGIVVGGGKWMFDYDRNNWYNVWDDSVQMEDARPHFEGLMQRHFKGWEDSQAKVDYMWTGIMGLTPDGMPHVGEVPGSDGRHYILAGFNGGGMDKIFLCAKGVAEMVCNGASYEDTGLPRLFKTTEERLK